MARLPPRDLIGLDPAWSNLVSAIDADGVKRTWHVLDNGRKSARGTVLCIHGNPNWSYMWRGLAQSLTDWRVIAVDALNMGFSERTGGPRRLVDHISDLAAVTRALDIEGPVITIAHDWGGPISMGWAQQNLDQLAGVVLMNTGVTRPLAVKVPPLISIARATLRATCKTTPMFLHGALRMARPQLTREVYRGYAAPYRTAALRTGVRDFVEDIPIEQTHESFETLAGVAAGLDKLQDVPALLMWGAKDIIFSDAFLHDLMQRLPHADVHRYPDAGHQIVEDTDAIDLIDTWINDRVSGARVPISTPNGPRTSAPIWSAVELRRNDDAKAIIEMRSKATERVERSISFGQLDERVQSLARGLLVAGIRPGDRLATLVPPGIDLTVLVYACLRAGIIVVAPDAGLGLDGLRRALRSSRPDYVVGDWRGLLLAKSLRLPATRLRLSSLDELAGSGSTVTTPAEPLPDDPAVVVFTSGSTGPSKGVVYTHRQLEAQRDALHGAFGIEPSDKAVVAFAPFAVLAPALGIPSVVPPMDVTKPAKLTAQTLADAATAIEATIVFASPAVLTNIAATSDDLQGPSRNALQSIRAVATAGAPVSPQLLATIQPVFPNAHFFTPYGMTELMPVTIASANEIGADASDAGVCVGQPLATVDLTIRPITAPSGTFPDPLAAGMLGEVWVRANHLSQGYDHLWRNQSHAFTNDSSVNHKGQAALSAKPTKSGDIPLAASTIRPTRAASWHRSGDVGHLDEFGRLWIEGRVDHLIHAATGVFAPVETELQAESVSGVDHAVAVGVGPIGNQQLAVVVAGESVGSTVVADALVTAAVRAAVSAEIAAVLVTPTIPVDRRHNSKIDRTRVQKWAETVLRGGKPPRL